MKEAQYQKKIMDNIYAMGGVSINGQYTKSGETDLQCGYPVTLSCFSGLLYIAIEVKTEKNYYRVMSAIDENYNVVDGKKLKAHEFLQMAKIRETRKRGGLALVAYDISQVKEYVQGVLNECRD